MRQVDRRRGPALDSASERCLPWPPDLPPSSPTPSSKPCRAELKRSITLTLNQLDKPYFVSYAVDDGHNWSATAALGALMSSDDPNSACPQVRIRVGDYNFDNTNYAGGGARGASYDLRSFPSMTTRS